MLKRYREDKQSFFRLTNIGAYGHLALVYDLKTDQGLNCPLLLIGYSLMSKNGTPGKIRNYHPVIPMNDLAEILAEGVRAEIISTSTALNIVGRLTESVRTSLDRDIVRE